MDYNFYLKNNRPDFSKLKAYGFCQNNDDYIIKRDLSESELYALIKISDEYIDVRVIDRAFEDNYIPFNVKDYPCAARSEVEGFLDRIVAECFICTNSLTRIIEYMEET